MAKQTLSQKINRFNSPAYGSANRTKAFGVTDSGRPIIQGRYTGQNENIRRQVNRMKSK